MASDKFDPRNMEAGELPKIDTYLVDDISDKLSIIGDLFKTCDKFSQCQLGQNPLEPLFEELWKHIIIKILDTFVMVDDIIEPVCRLIKHSMRALGQAFTQYLNVFLKKAMEGY